VRLATAPAVAVGLGLALGLLLTSAGSGSSGFGDQLAILVIIAAGVYIGWLVAQLASAALSVVVAPILVVIMLTVLFGVKFVRLPSAPLTGDGLELLGVMYVLPGALAALLGRLPWLRVPETTAVRNGRWVTGAALAIGAAWYLFYAVMAASAR
jgi:hypothetical protein